MAVSRLSQQSIQQSFPKGVTVWDGTTSTASMDAISFITVPSGGLGTVVFNNIPQTYTHLQIRGVVRLTNASSDDNLLMRFNSDATSGNYVWHYMMGNGNAASTAQAAAVTSTQTSIGVGRVSGASSAANIFGPTVIDVVEYSSTSKNKVAKTFTGHDDNGSGMIWVESGLWLSTAAVTSITLLSTSTFAQYTSFALYGIK